MQRSGNLLGPEALINGKVERKEDKIVVEAYLYDIVKGDTLLAKRYRSDPNGLRNISHHFANDVLEILTGEKGDFRDTNRLCFKKGEK